MTEVTPVSLQALLYAKSRFEAVLTSRPLPPDLHAVIVESPRKGLSLVPGVLPPLPLPLREKYLISVHIVSLIPEANVFYFGEGDYLGLFRDLSRVALAALRTAIPNVDSLVNRIQFCGAPSDVDHDIANCPLLLLRDIVGRAPDRKLLLDRWLWGDTSLTERVPYYDDQLQIWREGNPGVPVPVVARNVTIFNHDVFTFSVAALDWLAYRYAMNLYRPKAGHLGLVLDQEQTRVTREGFNHEGVSISKPRLWAFLEALYQAGDSFCPLEQLEAAWEAHRLGKPSLGSAQKARSDLAPLLEPLGVAIENQRRVGWRLIPAAFDDQSD